MFIFLSIRGDDDDNLAPPSILTKLIIYHRKSRIFPGVRQNIPEGMTLRDMLFYGLAIAVTELAVGFGIVEFWEVLTFFNAAIESRRP